MIDRAKFGEAVAKVMDRMDKAIELGELDEDFEIDNVLVVVAFVKLFDPTDELQPDAIDSMILVDGTTQIPYVQDGLLRYGIAVIGSGDVEV